MRHKLCRSFHPWCPGVKNRCLFLIIERTMTPRHLYWLTCSISFLLNVRFTWALLLLPITIDFVLISLTLMRLREQDFKSPSNWFCIPFSESESNTKSSVHSTWAMIFSSIHMPYSGARNYPKSAIYLRNSKPLATPPWLAPNTLTKVGYKGPLKDKAALVRVMVWHRATSHYPSKQWWPSWLTHIYIYIYIYTYIYISVTRP